MTLKRAFDFVVSLLVILIALPLWLAVTIAIKLDSPGPIFHRATRIGKGGKCFTLYKRAIPSRPYFTPIHLQPFYRERFGYREGDFPVTEAVARSVLALPFSSVMSEEQVEYVGEHLTDVLTKQLLLGALRDSYEAPAE